MKCFCASLRVMSVSNNLVSASFLVCAILFAGVASLKHFHRHLLVAYNTECLSLEREGQLLSTFSRRRCFLSVCKCKTSVLYVGDTCVSEG